MAIAGFRVAEFSTARELAAFVNTTDDVETVYATTFNVASGKFSIFFADVAGTANRYPRALQESVSATVADKNAWKVGAGSLEFVEARDSVVPGDAIRQTQSETASATESTARGVRGSKTETETVSATDIVDRSDP